MSAAQMKACPTCGAEMAAKLVDAIADPSREESCPKSAPAPRVTPVATTTVPVFTGPTYVPTPLATLLLLGSFVNLTKEPTL